MKLWADIGINGPEIDIARLEVRVRKLEEESKIPGPRGPEGPMGKQGPQGQAGPVNPVYEQLILEIAILRKRIEALEKPTASAT